MKIGIIGAGNVGTGLGLRLASKGHSIVVSFSRTQEAVEKAANMIGNGAKAGSIENAAAFGDVVIIATPWAVTLETVNKIASHLSRKIVWDTTNPFAPDMSELVIGTTTSAGEQLAQTAQNAHIVKAIPPFAELLHSDNMEIAGRKPGVFVCGDNEDARKKIVGLVTDVDADAINAGPLKLARFTEPLGMLVTNLAYVQKWGPRIGAVMVQER